MTVTAYVVWFIFMAVATMTILVVGTLGAADLLHRPRRSKTDERSPDSHLESQTEGARARQDSQSGASGRDADLVDALMPLGSSFSFVSKLNPPTDDNPRQGPRPTSGSARLSFAYEAGEHVKLAP
jgi:hypothetical protein